MRRKGNEPDVTSPVEKRGEERRRRTREALVKAQLDGVVCALPANVLLLSGYWPVIGNSLAVATKSGTLTLLVPEDEKEMAESGWADEVRTFSPASPTEIRSSIEIAGAHLAEVLADIQVGRGRILGFESGPLFEPASYASMHLYGASVHDLLHLAARFVALVPARDMLAELRSSLTPHEIDRVRAACLVAQDAFLEGAGKLHTGLREVEVAALFRTPISLNALTRAYVRRADGFTFCMSGENSARAFAAYQISGTRRLQAGDLVIVHCNSYLDGYWTDITRTFCAGEMDAGKRAMYDAVFVARKAAIETIHDGVRAAEVDRAARHVLTERGFGETFKHGLGHGVGFHAINHNAIPRLHPASGDVLKVGMVFNIEPAIYIEGRAGLRHCDVVALTENGAEVLTPFLLDAEELIID